MGKRGIAAFMFFTRLPIGRNAVLESHHFDRIINWWPITGFLTGGLTALIYFLCSYILSPVLSALIALISRLIITGGMHEDGLADFCDGFGGGSDRNRILSIMKDSMIGTYGVLGLIIYCIGFIYLVSSFPVVIGAWIILCSDVWCKFCSSLIVNFLPYARTREESKSHIIYSKSPIIFITFTGLLSIIPTLILGFPVFLCLLSVPIIVSVLFIMMKKRIGGYTGDCCGATFLISQFVMILTALIIYRLTSVIILY